MRLDARDREAIGSMLCVGFRGARAGDRYFDDDVAEMRRARVGGVILFDRDVATGEEHRNIEGAEQARALVGTLREHLGAKLIVAIDQEGGSVARLRPERGFDAAPGAAEVALMAAAARREIAESQARQVARLGVGLNFSPCVDVAVAPDGPVIGAMGRSFGADADVVVACALEVIDAHRRCGVAACVKHFPGHGSAAVDSHEALPDVSRTYDEARELGVFARLAREAPAVMVGHLLCARFDEEWPASLSKKTIEGVLRGRLGFGGVVVTDSLDMGALARRYSLEERVVGAVNAGADLLVHGFNAPGEAGAHPAMGMVEVMERGIVDGAIAGGMERVWESAGRLRRM